jgi:hypothetical protein
MIKYLLLAASALTSFYFVSCSCKATVPCSTDGVFLKAVGFTAADVDSILVVTYKADGAFDSVVDTASLRGYDNFFSNDTCTLDWAAAPGNDYKIIFPTTGNVYEVSQIKSGPRTTEDIPYKCEEGGLTGQSCSQPALSYVVNGNTIAVGGNTRNEVYYLVK